MDTRKLTVVVACLVACGGVVAASLRSGLFRSNGPRITDQWVEQGRDAYARIGMASIASEATTPAHIADLLGNASFEGPTTASPTQRAALMAELASFIYFRFVACDPVAYDRWQTQIGSVMLPRDVLFDEQNSIDEWYVTWLGDDRMRAADPAEYPALLAHLSDEQLFAEMFEWGLSFRGGANRPVGIANEPRGLCASIVTATREAGRPRLHLQGSLGPGLWHGGVAEVMQRWYRPSATVEELVARDGSVPFATVGVLMEFADGSRKPFHFAYAWDAIEDRWVLQFITKNNVDSRTSSPLEY